LNLNMDGISRNPSFVLLSTLAGLRRTIMICTWSLSSCLVQNLAILSNLTSNWYSSSSPSCGLFVKLMNIES
jgi:hypothetical protein